MSKEEKVQVTYSPEESWKFKYAAIFELYQDLNDEKKALEDRHRSELMGDVMLLKALGGLTTENKRLLAEIGQADPNFIEALAAQVEGNSDANGHDDFAAPSDSKHNVPIINKTEEDQVEVEEVTEE